MKLSGWGRYPLVETSVRRIRDEDEARQVVLSREPSICRGNGRAYGDSAVSTNLTVDARGMCRMLSFDADTGLLVAEAGVLLADVIQTFLPRGWFPAVTPGTKFVTLGGMVAADVHGKNHHREGSFGQFVAWIDVMDQNGAVRRCSAENEPELFAATLGGMGLTGVILRVATWLRRVETGWIRQTTRPAANLDHAMAMFEEADQALYSAAWIDCLGTGSNLGRSLILLGEHATHGQLGEREARDRFAVAARRKLTVPLDLPSWTLNRWSVKAFNQLYYHRGSRGRGERLVSWDPFFYPLDGVERWNRIYGRKGFLQFQCALPLSASRDGLRAILEATSRAGLGSFLAVLKRFGAQDSLMSFPMKGYTLALDFPASARCLALFDQLDRIVIDHGGRFYLAKDARMSRETLSASDPRAGAFSNLRQARGWSQQFQSNQSQRLGL